MKRYWKLILVILAILPLIVLFWPVDKSKIKILFIGNSYTYRNNMPHIFEEIAISKGKKVFVDECTLGKATLYIHSNRFAVRNAIKSQDWDYVIVQGSSRDFLNEDTLIEKKTLPALEKLISAIQKNNSATKMLFYMTWGYKNGYKPLKEVDTFEKMANKIRDEYLELYKSYNIGVVPVGMAWKDSRRKRSEVKLYVKDGAHPSLKGSYLAACCFYAAIFNDSPIGSLYFSKLGPKICYYLQSVASKNVMYQRRKYGLIDAEIVQSKN